MFDSFLHHDLSCWIDAIALFAAMEPFDLLARQVSVAGVDPRFAPLQF
jgi:hypothetical protein